MTEPQLDAMDVLDYDPKTNPETGREELANPERGCGFLKEEKAYIRTDPVRSSDGEIPAFVTFDPPIPYKEGTLRSYQQFDGLGFQRSLKDDFDTIPEGDLSKLWDRYENSEDGEHWGAITTAYSQDLLMWVGETYYDDPRDFVEESRRFGLNKAIPVSKRQEPPAINPMKTRVFCIHPTAYRVYEQTTERDELDSFTVDEGTPDDEVRRMVEDAKSGTDFNEYEILERHEDASDDVEHVEVRYYDHEDGPETEKVRVSYREDDNRLGTEDAEDPLKTIAGVVGYSYLTRVVWTAPSDGDIPKWAKQYEDTGQLDIVDVGEQVPEDEVADALPTTDDGDVDDKFTDPEFRRKVNETLTGPDTEELDMDDDSVEAVVPSDDDHRDVEGVSGDDLGYNELKRVASMVDADVSAQPSEDELVSALLDHEDSSAVADAIAEVAGE